jgi:hypothetical protein
MKLGEGAIARFLTFADTTRKQSPTISVGQAGNTIAGGELVTAQGAPAHQGRNPPQ